MQLAGDQHVDQKAFYGESSSVYKNGKEVQPNEEALETMEQEI